MACPSGARLTIRYAALLRQNESGSVRPGCFEGHLLQHTRFISVSRQCPNNRLTGRNLKSVPLRISARVLSSADKQPKLEIGPAHGPAVTWRRLDQLW